MNDGISTSRDENETKSCLTWHDEMLLRRVVHFLGREKKVSILILVADTRENEISRQFTIHVSVWQARKRESFALYGGKFSFSKTMKRCVVIGV